MNDLDYIIIDTIKWHIVGSGAYRRPEPLCPIHFLGLESVGDYYDSLDSPYLKCEECEKPYKLKRSLREQRKFVLNKLDSNIFKKMKFVNFDDEAVPIAEVKIDSEKSDYFVTGVLTQSKVGQRLIVYAGKKGSKEKAQIFIEPEIKRLAFDQKDLHPTEVFTVLEAIFKDGTKAKIEKGGDK